jgi:hypothetical protein
LEQLVVEAMKLGMELDNVLQAVSQHWKRLGGNAGQIVELEKGGQDQQ